MHLRASRPIVLSALALGVALVSLYPPPSHAREDTSRVLTFEAPASASALGGWSPWPRLAAGTLAIDSAVVHEGHYAGRIERDERSSDDFSAFVIEIPVDFRGDSLELRGWMKYENVTGHAGLWQREDGRGGTLAFDNMEDRGLKGSADWAEHRVALPIMPRAKKVSLGALLVGQGRLWVDDLRLYVDGVPLAAVPALVVTPTPMDTDHEFDRGSKVEIARLTPVQIDNLVMLGKVWGFLKYHHPAVVAGKRHWDYDLFRVLPRLLAASDRAGAQKVLTAWVDGLGEAPPCTLCVVQPKGLPLLPSLEWLSDRKLLGPELKARLAAIHANRPRVDEQWYVAKVSEIGNPEFGNESFYANLAEVDAGYRLLSLYRLWNVIEYWSPYRNLIEESWDGVLREFIPRLVEARNRDDYAAAMMALIARVHDTHANLWSSLDVRPPRGKAQVPVCVRFVENQAMVTNYTHPTLGPSCGLRIGDVIRAVNGVPVDTLVRRWRPMYAASNVAVERRDMARGLLRGAPGTVRLTVDRGGATQEVNATRVLLDSLDTRLDRVHDLPGPTFRRISDDLAYLKLSSIKEADVPDYLRGAAGARCLILDLRNYPSEFVVFELGQYLVNTATPFAVFTNCDIHNPGAFDWTEPVELEPKSPYFQGGVGILVDEITQSSAEYHAMALRTHHGSIVVGSTTAGADGNVSPLPLPGGLRTMISGIGVFYPDHRPTQRIGILPDVVVRPTIVGIRSGLDEVMEAAVERVLGRPMTESERAAAGGKSGITP